MLQLFGISKCYKTGDLLQQALDNVSFNLRDNEFVSILGPSGSGKTTLLNIIGGLDRYDEGDLIINGVSTKQYKNKDWDTYRNHTIGFVFQSYNLIPHQSILANVELALTIGGLPVRERRRKAKKALEDVGLGDQIHKRPNQLSGGQMQRVAIARALVNDPDILLADEPTGALDSETSIQIMDLLKQVAKDHLVVMVTHNAELAEQYSTRIITLRDGRIMSDSHPYDLAVEGTPEAAIPAQASKATIESASADGETSAVNAPEKTPTTRALADAPTSSAPKKRARMSFLTSLALSANNLRSKKGRTILISLASSIGIIGIALILSISTGVNDYILNIQKETMSSYPITISAQTIDINGLINEGTSIREEMREMLRGDVTDDGQVHADYSNMEASGAFTTSMVENNLTDLKKHLDDPDSDIQQYLGENGIVYTYNVGFDVYTYDPAGNFQSTDANVNDIVDSDNTFSIMSSGFNFMRANMFSWQTGTYFSSAYNFSEMAAGGPNQPVSQVIRDNYDLIYGDWPTDYNEVVIVLNRNNSLPAETLYQLGVLEGKTYKEISAAIEETGEAADLTWDYSDLTGRKFYLVTASDHYVANEDGTFSYLDDSAMNRAQLLENAVELTVSGIIRPTQDASSTDINTAVAYTAGLTDYCISHSAESPVIRAQMENPEINVLTGFRFHPQDDAEKAADAIDYIRELPGTEKAQLYNLITYYEMGETDTGNILGAESTIDDMLEMYGLSDNSMISGMMRLMGEDTLNSIFSNISGLLTDEGQQIALLDQWLEDDPDQEILVSLYDRYLMGGSYEDNLSSFGYVSYDAPTSINIYTDTFEDKDAVTAWIDQYNAQTDEDSRIVYTDYIALLTSSVTSIVNAISYVLIAFVAISLLVSCIMIGIITHISVLERTREIGILRAMGASRSNISHVFNAETVIIGLISGLLGVLIAAVITIPINLVLSILLGRGMINVNLPILYAVLLVAISVAVTVIGGLIPAAKASKKDPVIALRTE